MNRIIANKLDNFNSNIKYYEEKVSDKDEYYVDLKNRMKELTKMYFDTMDVEVKKSIINTLSECYDLLYYINFKKNPGRTFLLDDDIEKLPTIFLIDQKPKRFDINPGLLSDIDISKGLSEEQAEELLMWSSNNTRDNLNISSANSNIDEDVYDNDSLQGACGFSQFSSL